VDLIDELLNAQDTIVKLQDEADGLDLTREVQQATIEAHRGYIREQDTTIGKLQTTIGRLRTERDKWLRFAQNLDKNARQAKGSN
jgi:chromosome segregation ATPase